MKKKIICLIPARMNSSRFPGKPMKKINDIPMIEIVYKNVIKNNYLSQTAVATCDKEIFKHIKSIGGKAVMTSSFHERASDRCSEALEIIEENEKIKFDYVVMVQGDEPMINEKMITESLEPMLEDSSILVTNLLGKITDLNELNDNNCIKVIIDENNDAISFSRKSIRLSNSINNKSLGKQVCVIPFKRDFLIKYNSLKPTPLEKVESIDMLRILEHGLKVKMVRTAFSNQSVDTIDDLRKVENLLKNV